LSNFRKKLLDGNVSNVDWSHLKSTVTESPEGLPTHLKLYLSDLKKIELAGIPKDKIVIFDHGCGSGLSIIFLLACGYKNVFGVDTKIHKYENLNERLSKLDGVKINPFLTYSPGNKIDITPGTVNYIYSNQVMEHLSDSDLITYLTEEQRLKSNKSIIRHSFPTRNTFFETHTKTILLHWLAPKLVFVRLFGAKKRVWLENNLFLRWDRCYEEAFERYVGPFSQENIERIVASREQMDDGKAKSILRACFLKLMEVRALNPLLRLIYRNLATKEFVHRSF
jgi:2-polyprenyl-3-methyl-5-hydroxy-6-metoxy-1,4-benzoquinol methylase